MESYEVLALCSLSFSLGMLTNLVLYLLIVRPWSRRTQKEDQRARVEVTELTEETEEIEVPDINDDISFSMDKNGIRFFKGEVEVMYIPAPNREGGGGQKNDR